MDYLMKSMAGQPDNSGQHGNCPIVRKAWQDRTVRTTPFRGCPFVRYAAWIAAAVAEHQSKAARSSNLAASRSYFSARAIRSKGLKPGGRLFPSACRRQSRALWRACLAKRNKSSFVGSSVIFCAPSSLLKKCGDTATRLQLLEARA